jgi:hypothetical protein
MDIDRSARKAALQRIHDAVKMLPDEDIARAQKLVRTELRARGALSVLQSEIDDADAQLPLVPAPTLDEKAPVDEVVQPPAIARARSRRAVEVSE